MRTMHGLTRKGGWSRRLVGLLAAMILLPAAAQAGIMGEEGANFALSAKEGYVATPDGASIYSWGYAVDLVDGVTKAGVMQFPGPTLIVTEGDNITVTLTNVLPAAAGNVSIVFPGHEVSTAGGAAGLLTAEATPGGTVTYSFTASRPGTFLYHSGTRSDLQVEMGLVGALIVRPRIPVACAAGTTGTPAYNNPNTCYDDEFLFLLSEIDIDVHQAVESQIGAGTPVNVPTNPYESEYWFINGRCAPDTMAEPGTTVLAHQPYDAMPFMNPGDRILMRLIGGGRQLHPFHHHGNHSRVIARDAHLLVNGAGDLVGPSVFTITSVPGGTADAIFEWTGRGLGWDIYGHVAGDGSTCSPDAGGYDVTTREWCADHTKPLPVQLPADQVLTFGGFWSGSPFLGTPGTLPPGEGGLNPSGGFTYMWHSHTERELINNDIFPGGMMTMLVINPPGL